MYSVCVCIMKLYLQCGGGGKHNLGAGCVGLQDVSRGS